MSAHSPETEPGEIEPEALSMIEFASIPRGTRAVDALVKKAPIALERVGTVQPGTMAVLFSGDVASVEASHTEALRIAEDRVHDETSFRLSGFSRSRAGVGGRHPRRDRERHHGGGDRRG
jgi:hypothetical protein